MKTSALFLSLVALPFVASAAYPVHDAMNFQQLLRIYTSNRQILQETSRILGVSRDQLNQLEALNDATGAAQAISADPEGYGLSEIRDATRGMQRPERGPEVEKLYKGDGPFKGSLDMFMGFSVEDWRSFAARPAQYLSNWAVTETVNGLGEETGMDWDERKLLERVAQMSSDERAANREMIQRSAVALALRRSADGTEARRQALQTEANLTAKGQAAAAAATSVNERLAASNDLAAAQNRILINSANAQMQANELSALQANEQTELLRAANAAAAREAAARRMAQAQ